MTNQDPSEIRCPTCGRLTPFAPFCTHCGAVIQEAAGGARPHAMDRAELERRIRQRRQEGPFHRGEDERDGGVHAASGPSHAASGPAHAAAAGSAPLGAFLPEPTDELARHEQAVPDEQPRVDYFDERAARRAGEEHDWGSNAAAFVPPVAGGIPGAAPPPAPAAWPSRDLVDEEPREPVDAGNEPPSSASAPAASDAVAQSSPAAPAPDLAPVPRPYQPATPFVPDHAYEPAALAPSEPTYRGPDSYRPGSPYAPGDDGGEGGDEPGWTGYDEEPPRRGSGGPAIVGFLVLGLAALLGGAFLFAALNAPKPASDVTSPSPTSSASSGESASPTQAATASQLSSPTAAPPTAKFRAKVEPCGSSSMGFSGCATDGTHLRGNQVWVWVGFENGQASTVIGVTIVNQATKAAVGDGSVELDQIPGCDPGKSCSGGYVTMSFGNLDPGKYEIRVTGDGDPAASTTFTVSS